MRVRFVLLTGALISISSQVSIAVGRTDHTSPPQARKPASASALVGGGSYPVCREKCDRKFSPGHPGECLRYCAKDYGTKGRSRW
jgi:hypothetical protein